MAEAEGSNLPEVQAIADGVRQMSVSLDLDDPIKRIELVYQLWWHWADFHLHITSPTIERISPPIIHEPETLPGGQEKEFVYAIHDHGSQLSTSKAEELLSVGSSMCKLYYTIEKMIAILVERFKSGGIDVETEVQVAFQGHELAQRKAFEVIINLAYNVVVTNFDPGVLGEQYLDNVKRLAEKYGYPPEAPRDIYKKSHGSGGAGIKR